MDIVDKATRSRMMSGIVAKHTKPELLIRSLLYSNGYRYRLHRTDLPGKPDIVLPKFHAVFYIHGCFWHVHEGCRYFKWPTSHIDFWQKELRSNQTRDKKNMQAAIDLGWRVLVIWECATRDKAHQTQLIAIIREWLSNPLLGDYCEVSERSLANYPDKPKENP